MLEMKKPLILWAVLANTLLMSPCSGNNRKASASASALSSSSWASSSSSSTSQSTSITRRKTQKPRDNDGCGWKERMVKCPFAVCVPKTCDDVGYPVACPDLLPNASCPDGPGCICIENYVKNKQGVCIEMKYCPSCGGDENAVSGCGCNCNRLCSNYNNSNSQCNCPDECLYNSCECKPGFLFDEIKRKCVKPEYCSKLECKKPNEVYDPCPAPCPLRICGINDAAVDCVPALYPGNLACAPPKCRCEDGFYRDDKGQCVTLDECPTCLGINEIYDPCPAPCPAQRCDVDPAAVLCTVSPQIGDPECEPGCRCFDGYVRNYTGNVCINREDCPTCPQNEIYDICDAPCPPRRCDVDERLIKCAAPPKPGSPDCVEGCRCVDGYKRDSNGNCIPADDCPTCLGINEIYDPCPPACPPQRCDINPALVLCAVPPQYGDPRCEPGCRCIDGYVRNYTGNVCIKREDCPTCPQNEIYDICDAPCPPRRCDVDERLIRCAAPPEPGSPDCVEGCRCVDGYKRDSNGNCIPAEDCPKCTKLHEVYDPCPPTCPPQTCESINKRYNCPNQPVGDDGEIIQTCVGQCVCEPGYYRNKLGDCISEENCLKCTGPNEYFSCDSACDNVCGLLDTQNRTNCPIKNIICNDRCYCEDGYARDENNICIPIEDCNVPKCKKYERYDACPAYLCQPLNCSQLGYPVPYPYTIQAKCPGNPGCICIDGYVRDDKTGQCIRKEQCPSCGGDYNATSGCGVNCNKRCRDVGKKQGACIDICYENECDCNDGYYLDENTDQCVKPEDCTPVCPINEVYSECVQGGCNPKKCSDLGFPVRCPRIDSKFCKKGCVCRDGKVRNSNGICVDKSECPSCGGDPNARSGCGIYCNQRCSTIGQEPELCIALCKDNACDCKGGYYFDEECKKCVLPEDCTKPFCKMNEYFNNCSNSDCSPQNCNDLGFPIKCTDIEDPSQCTKDCLCKVGYVRNNKGICIPSRECPSCGGDPNAVSGCGGYCNKKCSNIGKEQEICILLCRLNGCDCREGYYYDEIKKLCVLPDDCTPQCPINEYYSNCVNGDCSVQNCKDVGMPISCPRIDTKYCEEGCLCIDGYARNSDGVCVPKNECPTCKGDPNQIAGCGVYCNQKCSDLGKEPGQCILICKENSCECRKGYYLDESTGRCVKPQDCPLQCPENEYYSNCTNGDCSVQNCADVGLPISCERINPKYCKKGCLCNEGYARNDEGVCFPKNECPTCKGDPNQIAGCGVYCNQKCSDLGKKPGPCIFICYVNSCDCRKGYYLDESTGKCVKPQDCPAPQCPENEYYSNCANGDCSVQNCTDVGMPIACPRLNSKYCKGGCLCNEGYARNAKGICVPLKECPTCKGDPNRVSGCGVYCNRKCSDIGEKPVGCIKICYENDCDCREGYYLDTKTDKCVLPKDCTSCKNDPNRVPGCGVYCNQKCADVGKKPGACIEVCYDNACDCKKGYVLDENIDKCVKPNNCTPVCGNNEVYSDCINGGCEPKNCSQLGKDIPCVKLNPNSCIEGCLCKTGYLRDKNGICVPESECNPIVCTRPNEEYNPCFYNCPPQTCESLDRAYVCPIREGDQCKAQCVCKQGFYRNKLGDCISEANCRKCMGPHEYFSCGGACDNVCATIKKQNQTKCPIVNIKCNEMCYCEENYARALNKTCIPIDKCNEPQCGVNERYEKCPQKLRGPFTCSQLGFPVRDNSKKDCGKPACVCVEGYLRDSNKVCVPKTDCPSCGGDKNAVSGCGNCKALCEDLGNDEPRFCTQICYENACDCRDGYYYDRKLKKCVLPVQCTSICNNENEYFENCENPRCRANTCGELGFPLNCSFDSSYCKKGCYCKDDFVRNEDGKCIPVRECPSCGGDVNAQSGCGVNCLKHCYDLANPKYPRPCPRICNINSCDCKDGFYLDENINQCVEAKECSPICGKDEVYDPCTNGGCEFRNCSQIGGPQICIDPLRCIKGCKCKQDYLRAKNATCIPIEKCPEAKCPKKERFEKCPAALCQPQTCDDLGIEVPCLPTDGGFCPGGPGCVCEEEYVRNKRGKCIPKRQCPSCGGDPNAWSGCGVNCGKHCDDVYNKTRPCPRICYPNSCDCKDDFYYNEITGKCVEASNCPLPCPENEKRDFCVNGYCGIRNCSQANGPILCVDPIECRIGCTCIKGYLRDDETGKCVPECECPTPPEKCNTLKCVTCINNCTEGPPVDEAMAIANFNLGNDQLNREFLYQLVKGRPGESFIFSAFSVLITLTQLTLYATGIVLDQLLRLLKIKSKDEIRTAVPNIIKSYLAQESVIIKINFKYLGSINYPFTNKFKKEAEVIFDSAAENLDFARNIEAADNINDWVRNRTNNLIDNLVEPSMFSEATRLVLVNVLYFLGDWLYQFNPNETKPQNFYYGKSDNEVLSLPTMCQEKRFLYAENEELDCQILRLPYKGQNFTFDIYLPRTRDGLSSMIEKIRNTDNIFGKIGESLKYENVRACIPKMDITSDLSNLSELLQMVNLTAPFDPNSDGFECIFENESSVYISDAVQKCRIKVDETGTEAAAATAVVLTFRSLKPTSVLTFNADHPFLFILRFLDYIVFAGVFYK